MNNLRKIKRCWHIIGIASLLLAMLHVNPVAAAGKQKTIILKAGQTCYVTTKPQSGKNKAGNAKKITVKTLTANSRYDYIKKDYEKPVIKLDCNFKTKKFPKVSNSTQAAFVCTSGKVKVIVSDYSGRITITKSSKLPYTKAVISEGTGKTIKNDTIYFVAAKVGSILNVKIPKGMIDNQEYGFDITFKKQKFELKLLGDLADVEDMEEMGPYNWKKGNQRGIFLPSFAGIRLNAEKGDVMLYKLKWGIN